LELNWSTFVLEIINFLVLVWILKRFLYRPVLAMLRQRQQEIEAKLDEASRLRSEGSELQQQYEGRLEAWERERQQARDSLHEEIRSEKASKLEQMEKELAAERQAAAIVDERGRNEERQRYQQTAHAQGASFAARLLESSAGPELERHLFDLLLQSLDEMNTEQRNDLLTRCRSSGGKVKLTSAFPMSSQQIEELQKKLSEPDSQAIEIEHRQDPQLVAGFHLVVDSLVLHLNVHDELEGYADLLHGKI